MIFLSTEGLAEGHSLIHFNTSHTALRFWQKNPKNPEGQKAAAAAAPAAPRASTPQLFAFCSTQTHGGPIRLFFKKIASTYRVEMNSNLVTFQQFTAGSPHL